MHGTQLHGKQLSSYKLQAWLVIINSVMQVESAQATKKFPLPPIHCKIQYDKVSWK